MIEVLQLPKPNHAVRSGDVERWLWAPGYEGLYEVSDHGRVRSYVRKTPRIMKSSAGSGYPTVSLWRDGRGTGFPVHCLVLRTFVGPPRPFDVGRHLDGDVCNARVENLSWGSRGDNSRDYQIHAKLFGPGQILPGTTVVRTFELPVSLYLRIVSYAESEGLHINEAWVRLVKLGLDVIKEAK